jgi:predicted transcriptional regulator
VNPGVLLVTARHKAGLSQRDLARKAGVPQSTIARIESGFVSPRLATFERLLSFCGFRLVASKLGEGVDRTVMHELIKLTPDELLESAAADAHEIAELLASVRR